MAGRGDSGETIVEHMVRAQLSRTRLRDLLDGFGSQTSGSRDEMPEGP